MDCITRPHRSQPLFELGQLVATPGALEACSNVFMQKCLARHLTGDWGCICPQDALQNEAALTDGNRLMSAYVIDPAKPCTGYGANTLWIITEGDRSVTTFLLPAEY